MMSNKVPRRCSLARTALTALLLMLPIGASAQEVGLVKLDVEEVAKGHRANALELKSVFNDTGEIVGQIDDFNFSRDGSQVFAILSVGEFAGLGANLSQCRFAV